MDLIKDIKISKFKNKLELGNSYILRTNLKRPTPGFFSTYTKSIKDITKLIGSSSVNPPKESSMTLLKIVGNKFKARKVIKKCRLEEARGFYIEGDNLFLNEENCVKKINLSNEIIEKFKHPFFKSLHTIKSFDEKSFIISSTGYDTILIVDKENFKTKYKWTAWENGYNKSPNDTFVYLKGQEITKEETTFIINPKNPKIKLANANQTTHLNSAVKFFDEDRILSSFFHQGQIVLIDIKTNKVTVIFKDLGNPHGCEINSNNSEFYFTDTCKGIFYICDKDTFKVKHKVDLICNGVELKDRKQWIQDVILLKEDLFVAIDNKENRLIFFSLKNKAKLIKHFDKKTSVNTIKMIDKNQYDKLCNL